MIKKYPSHWVITELENAGKVTTGNPAPQEKQYFINGITPFVRVADLGQLGDSVYIKNTKDKLNEKINNKLKLYPKGSVLFTKSGMSLLLNQRAILGSNMYVVSHIGIVIPNQDISSEWIYYWFRTIDFKKYAHATTLPSLKISLIRKMNFPLPPINEQNRIVEKIEELFSDLDKATEDLKKTWEQLKIYRQAVLKAAFEGKLLEMGLAKYSPFSEICDINPSKQEIGELNDDLEVTFLPMLAVSKTGVILEKKIKRLKDVKKGYTFFKNGDVLLAKITPCFENGKKAIVKELKNNIGFGSTEFHVLRPKEEVISEWIYYGVSLEDFRNKAKSQMTGTAGQKRVPKRVLESYAIPIPTKPIQEKIVKEIESRLSVCDKVEKTVEQNLIKIEYLRQSILKKAFEGKLVPQDPNDLPACELLKQIKIKKDKMSKNGK